MLSYHLLTANGKKKKRTRKQVLETSDRLVIVHRNINDFQQRLDWFLDTCDVFLILMCGIKEVVLCNPQKKKKKDMQM